MWVAECHSVCKPALIVASIMEEVCLQPPGNYYLRKVVQLDAEFSP